MLIVLAVLSRSETATADQSAFDRMALGDHDALGEIYDRHGRLVYSLALRIMRDQADAEDVVQEVFSQAWRQAARYDASRGSVLAWLLTLARSRALDRVRSRRCRPESSGEALVAEIPDRAAPADEQLVWQGQALEIRAALEALSMIQRIAIELAFYEGMTHAEIAERLELPLGTVKTRIRQGLLKLRDRLVGVL